MKSEDFRSVTREEMLSKSKDFGEQKATWLSQSIQKPAQGVRGTIHFTPERGHWFRVYHEDKSFTDYELNHFDLEVEVVGNYASLFENTETGEKTIDYPEKKNLCKELIV